MRLFIVYIDVYCYLIGVLLLYLGGAVLGVMFVALVLWCMGLFDGFICGLCNFVV